MCARLTFILLFQCVGIIRLVNSQDDEMGKVVFVNILFRHGDRTPIALYPADPYQNKSYWPEGFGQLTNVGKRQHYELGQWLRKRYGDLLTEKYSPDIVHVQSSDFDRTLMSAESNLAGMYPPRGEQLWNSHLAWQPIPIHTIPSESDNVIAQSVPCPTYIEEFAKIVTTDENIRQLNATYSDLCQYMSKHAGANITLMTVEWIRDCLNVENLRNLTLPEWTEHVYPEPMLGASIYFMLFESWTPRLARLRTGLLLKEMIKNMQDKLDKKTTRNVHIYSAHDENIVNLLHALGAFNFIYPPYASCIMLELRVNSVGNRYVTIYYRNSTTEGPYLMKIAGCDPVCDHEKFLELSRPLIPEDWYRECGLSGTSHGYLLIIIVAMAAIVIVILIVATIFYKCRERRVFKI